MYLHLGEETVIRSSDLVAIIDTKQLSSDELAYEEIEALDQHSTIKSIVITRYKKYYSSISASTLKRKLTQTPYKLDKKTKRTATPNA